MISLAILQTLEPDDCGSLTRLITGTTSLHNLPNFLKWVVYDTEVCGLEITHFIKGKYKPGVTRILPRNWIME